MKSQTQFISTNGQKSASIRDSWDFVEQFGIQPYNNATELYSRVAAAFRAITKTAQAVANMPFALVDVKTGEDYDSSSKWENKVGFMPRPKELLRQMRQSLIITNRAYCRMGKNVAGRPKTLHYTVPTSIKINTDAAGDLKNLERMVNGIVAKTYAPDDTELMRWWWLDENTELLPSENTEIKAIMQSAGIIFYSDFFTANFYQRGGIRPTLIAMKGMVSPTTQGEQEKSWTEFLRGIGRGFAKAARVFNAEAMDVKPFGDGLGDLKDTPVYRQSLENIALGMGMPVSILLSDSANYATAQVEYAQWYRDSITPWCDFIAEGFNDQLFLDLGLRMEFRPENTDPEQEDEVSRAQAFSTFGDTLAKYPDSETFLGAAATFGFELTPDLVKAVEAHYAKKQKDAEIVAEQTKPKEEPAPVVVEEPKDMEDDDEDEAMPAKSWTIDQLNELRVWREVAMRRFRKGESLDFEYQPHYGGLPNDVTAQIKARLLIAPDPESIKAAFEIEAPAMPGRERVPDVAILKLADAINRAAEASQVKAVPAPAPQTINITMPGITAQMPAGEPSTVTVNIPPSEPVVQVAAPVVNVDVAAPDVTVANDVQPAPVVVQKPRRAKITFDRNGKPTGLEAE